MRGRAPRSENFAIMYAFVMHFGMNVHNLKRMTAMVNVHTTRGYTIARRPTGQGVRQQRMRWPIGDGGASNDGGGAGGSGDSSGGEGGCGNGGGDGRGGNGNGRGDDSGGDGVGDGGSDGGGQEAEAAAMATEAVESAHVLCVGRRPHGQ